jgi:hypothetical protein
MANKYLKKIASKLPADMKGYAKKLIDKARNSGKPAGKPKILAAVMKPAQKGSFGHDVLRAKKVAARATRDDGKRVSAAGKTTQGMSKAASERSKST